MKRLLFWALLCCLMSCNPHKAEHSFYYWKTGATGDTAPTRAYISKLGIDHFYFRILDVDWNERLQMPVPVSPLDRIPEAMTGLHFTPVVFITNRTFTQADERWCDSLAVRLAEYLNRRITKLQPDTAHATFNEIQVDCDWTPATQGKYFRFLRHFKSFYPGKTLSATIRLYPYKYPEKMGVPPVDKGMLMCYNLGRIDKADTRNSVFDYKELQLYLGTKKYPLPLDIALPVFGWYAWFRGSVFKGIIYENELNIKDTAFAAVRPGQWRARQDFELTGKYLREGDELRREFPAEADLKKAAALLHQKIPDAGRIAFFHWNEPTIDVYENTIRHIYAVF